MLPLQQLKLAAGLLIVILLGAALAYFIHEERVKGRADYVAAEAKATAAFNVKSAVQTSQWAASTATAAEQERENETIIATAAGRALESVTRLRQRAAVASVCSVSSTSPAASGGEAASSPGVLQPDVLGRVAEAARLYSLEADKRGNSGATCENAWPQPSQAPPSQALGY